MKLPSTPEDRNKLKEFIEECVREKTIIDSANEQIKEIRSQAKDRFEVSPTDFNKLLKAAYDSRFADDNYTEAEELLHNYEILYKGKKEEN